MGTTALDLGSLYRARRGMVEVVDVPDLAVLVVDGAGRPGGPGFTDAVETVQPPPVDAAVVAEALERAHRRPPPALDRVRLERWELRPHGRHHEIYLDDPRRSRAERLRTILRHPVQPA